MIIENEKQTSVPIVVDLDGTLIRTDLLFESTILFLKQYPLKIIQIIIWLFQGIQVLKSRLAEQIEIDIKNLPYNLELLDYLKEKCRDGRKIVLATASHYRYAHQIAELLGIFSHVFATNENVNLKGSRKLKCLIDEFGEQGFEYIGDSAPDLKIFPHARRAVLVNPKLSVITKIKGSQNIEIAFQNRAKFFPKIFKAIRIHQWLKNLLLFVPVFTSHNWLNFDMLLKCLIGFVAMGLCASGTYLLNDLLDLQSDRAHPRKKYRPLAAGDISVSTGMIILSGLLITGLSVTFFLSKPFFTCIIVYMIITLTYSFLLKRMVMLDVISLASLYTIRVVAGALLVTVPISFWLLAFSIFIFFSLALVKRCTELQLLNNDGKSSAKGRGYHYKDLSTLRSMGIAGGFLSVIVFSLYMNSNEVLSLYSKPQILWLICPILLYWISRMWILTGRDEMDDDPVIFAIKDKVSVVILALVAALVVIASSVK